MELEFEKWHGNKNDFILVWLPSRQLTYLTPSFQRQALKLCSKAGDGIGADTMLLIETPTSQPNGSGGESFHLTIINKDGSLAQNCGNGLRCAALSARSRFPLLENGITFKVMEKNFFCDFFSKDMVVVSMENSHKDLDQKPQMMQSLQASFPGFFKDYSFWNLGNLHLVSFIDHLPKDLQILEDAAKKAQTMTPDGVNVHFAAPALVSQKTSQIIKGQTEEAFDVYVYERGVGPTQACGSGAGAITLALLDKGFSDRSLWVTIGMPGGSLFVQQRAKDEPIRVMGPGELVFRGKLFL